MKHGRAAAKKGMRAQRPARVEAGRVERAFWARPRGEAVGGKWARDGSAARKRKRRPRGGAAQKRQRLLESMI